MGVDVAYVSDYVDNHQQMASDLKENEAELNTLLNMKQNFVSTSQNELQFERLKQNIEHMEQKWLKLKRTVEQRICVAADYLVFVKQVNQFRGLGADLQELFKTLSMNATSDTLFENHVQEKMHAFERLHRDLMKNGTNSISILKQVNRLKHMTI